MAFRRRGRRYLASNAHGGGAVVLLLQELPDASEVGQLEPAGLEAAGAGDAVTFAGYVCEVIGGLVE